VGKQQWFAVLLILVAFSPSLRAAENLRLNPKLNYSSDSQDGPLITGDHMDAGTVRGKPNYVLIFQEGCFNSKRQARRSVSLYEKYRGRVNFVIIDLDRQRSPEQRELVESYFKGSIPHVVILSASGKVAYNEAGEVEESAITEMLDKLLKN
jgi:hypothetical protein